MRKTAAILWLLLVLLLGTYLIVRMVDGLNFNSDLMALVPTEDQNEAAKQANDSVTRALSKKIVLLVGHEDRNQARAAATEISRILTDSGLFQSSAGGIDSTRLKQIGASYFPFRHGLLSDEDRHSLKEGRAQDISTRALSQIFGVIGLSDAGLLKADPFLLMPRFLAGLPVPMSRLAIDDGLLSVNDDGKTWVLVTGDIKGEPYSLDVQNKFSGVLDAAIQGQSSVAPKLTILRTGALFFAKAGAQQAMHESSIIGFVSLVATILLLLVAFRSAYPLFMSLLVVAVGLMVALSLSLWIWRDLHIFALLFGVSLIGVTVDYSLQYCSEVFVPCAGSAFERLERVFVAISLGAATTIIGYMSLMLAPLPGLQQIALFSVIGLLASWITVVLWLPFLDHMKIPSFGHVRFNRLTKGLLLWEDNAFIRYRLAILAVLLVAFFVGSLRFHVDDDVRKLQSLSAPLVIQQERIQQLTGSTNAGQFFVVQMASEEEALQKEEALADRLTPLVTSGALRGFQSLAAYVPSLARQAENRQLLVESLYKPLLGKQAAMLNLSTVPPLPEEKAAGLTLDAKGGPISLLGFLSLLKPKTEGAGVVHIVMLEGVTDTVRVAAAAEGLTGVRFVNPVHDFTILFGKYRSRAILLLVVSAVLMVPLLAMRYGIKKASGVMGPPLLAVVLTPLVCALLGSTFTFFDAIALVLVLSMGMDYSIFFMETTPERKPITLFAVSISALSTIMSFGFLAFSDVLAVHNFGLTMFIGVALSFVFAPFAQAIPMIFNNRRVIIGALVVFLGGCSSQPIVSPSRQVQSVVQIAPALSLHLPSFHDLDKPVDVVQQVIATYGDQVIAFEGRINATTDHFTMVCMDPMGRKAITISWTDSGLEYEAAPWIPAQLRPENMLADLVVIYWPAQLVEQALGPSATVRVDQASRSVLVDGKEVLRVTYAPIAAKDAWSGQVTYANLAWNYSLRIQSLALSP